MIRNIAAAFLLLLSTSLASAAEKTVVLNVKNANCELCAPIVKRVLAGVQGVTSVDVKQADQMADPIATVKYDDTLTNVPALVTATTNAGYPSSPTP
jgi:mercuric ion binding protein